LWGKKERDADKERTRRKAGEDSPEVRKFERLICPVEQAPFLKDSRE
jgi:hypothetical protein